MVNINAVKTIKIRFWQKVMMAFCLIAILFSLLSISSSFATIFTLNKSTKSDVILVFSGMPTERVRMAFPAGGGLSLSHNLGVDLGIEKTLM